MTTSPAAAGALDSWVTPWMEWHDAVVHREIVRVRARYELTLDEFRGLDVSNEQVDRLVEDRLRGRVTGPITDSDAVEKQMSSLLASADSSKSPSPLERVIASIGSCLAWEFKSPMIKKSGSPLPVGSVANQSTKAHACAESPASDPRLRSRARSAPPETFVDFQPDEKVFAFGGHQAGRRRAGAMGASRQPRVVPCSAPRPRIDWSGWSSGGIGWFVARSVRFR